MGVIPVLGGELAQFFDELDIKPQLEMFPVYFRSHRYSMFGGRARTLLMRLAGLEPAAYCLGGSRSIHLSYKRV